MPGNLFLELARLATQPYLVVSTFLSMWVVAVIIFNVVLLQQVINKLTDLDDHNK